jgi:hypothetical protein
MQYELHHRIEDASNLAQLFNMALSQMDMCRIVSAPRTFEAMDSEYGSSSMYLFYHLCLYELWMHRTIDRLKEWQKEYYEYQDCNCSWEYFAYTKYRESIKEGFGEPEDYDDVGNPVARKLTKEQLESYTLPSYLLDEGLDIVQDTKPMDLQGMKTILILRAEFMGVDAIKQAFGVEIPMYQQVTDEDGEVVEMRRMTLEDIDLKKAMDSVTAEDLYNVIIAVCGEVQSLIADITQLPKFKDNKKELESIMSRVSALLAADFRISYEDDDAHIRFVVS